MNILFLKRVALFIFVGFFALLMIKVKVDHILLWDMIYAFQNVAANPDADYYLKLARDLMEQQFSYKSITQTNLLSIVIAFISKSANVKDLIWAGNLLTPICCALTFLAVGLFFSIKSNFSPWGWLVAFLSLLTSYLSIRMGPGYIDTDLLNTFFVYLISALIYFLANVDDLKNKYFLAATLGVLNFLFIRWYGHEGFTILFVMAIIASQWCAKEKRKHILGFVSVFILLSSLASVNFFGSATGLTSLFITDQLDASIIVKSGIKVSELQVSEFKAWPHILFEWRYHWAYGLILVALSLIGNLFWLLTDIKKLCAYFIPFVFIPMSFFVGDRFYIYIIPIFWFGLFYMIKVCMIKIKVNTHVAAFIAILFTCGIFFTHYSPRCFFVFEKTCHAKVTLFRFPTIDVTNAIKFANKDLIQENNTLLAWWDYGHYLALHTKFNLVFSPSSPFIKDVTTFIDTVLLDDEVLAYQKLKEQYSKELKINKVYILVNRDLIYKIPYFYEASSSEKITMHKKEMPITSLECTKKSTDEMWCNKELINYRNGTVNQSPGIFKIIYLDHQGKFLSEKILNKKGKNTLVHFSLGKDITQNNIIIPKWMSETILMKLYLGQFNPKLFKLVSNHFPDARIYELN
ncbi:MAG: hypothetical protein EXR41_04430 [Candidatus Methylopumilus sp.]|nr:hypothetical protein [Candidatus Methylopumilus sp.]